MYSLRKAYHGIVGNAYSLSNVGTWNSGIPKMSTVEKFASPNFYRSSHNVDTLLEDAE